MREPRDPWKLGELERLRERFREIERREGARETAPRGRRLLTRAGAVAGVLAAAVAVVALDLVTPARAGSPVNHAPVAAAESRSVRFTSRLEVSVGGGCEERFSERGTLDFSTGNYDTLLNIGRIGRPIGRRRVGNVFYGVQFGPKNHGNRAAWRAIRVSAAAKGAFTQPGGFTLLDPEVVFRVLEGTRSRTTRVGHQQLDGVATTRYSLVTNLAAFLAADHGSRVSDKTGRRVSATLEVWLDQDGRPRRVQARFATSPSGSPSVTTVVDFTDYGAPVAIRAPSHYLPSPIKRPSQVPLPGGDPTTPTLQLLFGQN